LARMNLTFIQPDADSPACWSSFRKDAFAESRAA
jgi:hypothetical protein